MRLYSCSLIAVRDHPNNADSDEISLTNGLVLVDDNDNNEDIDRAAIEKCNDLYPVSDGYRNHMYSYTEITQNMCIGNIYLSWITHEVSA